MCLSTAALGNYSYRHFHCAPIAVQFYGSNQQSVLRIPRCHITKVRGTEDHERGVRSLRTCIEIAFFSSRDFPIPIPNEDSLGRGGAQTTTEKVGSCSHNQRAYRYTVHNLYFLKTSRIDNSSQLAFSKNQSRDYFSFSCIKKLLSDCRTLFFCTPVSTVESSKK